MLEQGQARRPDPRSASPRKGIAAVGKLIPIGPLLKKPGRLVRPLLNRVIRFAIGRPAHQFAPGGDTPGPAAGNSHGEPRR